MDEPFVCPSCKHDFPYQTGPDGHRVDLEDYLIDHFRMKQESNHG